MQTRMGNMLYAVASTVLEHWRDTGEAVPQGPIYAAMMGSMTFAEFCHVLDVLSMSGFIVTSTTIKPGREIQESLAKSKELV